MVECLLDEIQGCICYLAGDIKDKAAGPDEIPTQFLKEFSELLDLTYCCFQALLNQYPIPSNWKRAYIVPIFKKGNRAIPNNYRPVFLTCITQNVWNT